MPRRLRGLNRKRAVAMTSQPNIINIMELNPPSGDWSPPGTEELITNNSLQDIESGVYVFLSCLLPC